MKKINLDQLQQDINNRQLRESEQPMRRTEQQELLIERVWETLTDVYGNALVSQYGTTMPEAWVLLLTGITSGQIKNGLNSLASRNSPYPPNGAEFRQLCIPDTISPDGTNSAAYLSFDDPKHPENEFYGKKPKKLVDKTYESKRKKSGNEALKNLKGIF